MAGNKAENVSRTFEASSHLNKPAGHPQVFFHIETDLISPQLSGIPHVFLNREQCEVRTNRFRYITKLIKDFHPTGIRADSHPSGGWYIYFPPDTFGRVNAGQCANYLNNLKTHTLGVNMKAQYVSRLGEREPPDSPSNPIGASTMSRHRLSELLNTKTREGEAGSKDPASEQLIRELELSISVSNIPATTSNSHTSFRLHTDARTIDSNALAHPPSSASSTSSINKDIEESANTIARDVGMSQQRSESTENPKYTSDADAKTSHRLPQQGEGARYSDTEEAVGTGGTTKFGGCTRDQQAEVING